MTTLTFDITTTPKAKQSARFFAKDNKVFSFQNKEVVQQGQTIQAQIKEQLPEGFKILTEYCSVSITAKFQPTKQLLNKKASSILLDAEQEIIKTTKPDVDNLIKQVLDVMQGVVFVNDSIVHKLSIRKVYTTASSGYIVSITGE